MMNCKQAKQLLPLWVGQDLPDVASAASVAEHLERCPDCENHQKSLQASLDCLQGSSAETLAIKPGRSSVWPQLALRISDWENRRNRDRFEGWLPATVMALAVVIMLAASIPAILEEFSGGDDGLRLGNLFQSEQVLERFRASDDKSTSPVRPVHANQMQNLKRDKMNQW